MKSKKGMIGYSTERKKVGKEWEGVAWKGNVGKGMKG